VTAAATGLGAFVLRTFLWLPACFAAWYFSAQLQAAVVGRLARVLVELFKSGIVSALERSGFELVFVTTLEVHPVPGQTAVLLAEVNPLLYTYGLALFLALMLASRARWWTILVGAVALLPFQSFGVACDFLVQVGVRFGPDVAAQAGLLDWRREAIALGYQLGSLILPSLVPVVMWAGFNRPFIATVLQARAARATVTS
jgi:hypothetical protein